MSPKEESHTVTTMTNDVAVKEATTGPIVATETDADAVAGGGNATAPDNTAATNTTTTNNNISTSSWKSSTSDGGFYYLSDDARRQLPNYKYRGTDLSLVYKYVLSPLAQWFVDNVTPLWVAPNTITTIGLVWMVTSYVAYWYYVPSLNCNDYYSFHNYSYNIYNNDDQNNIFSKDGNDNDIDTTSTSPEESFVLPRWIFLWNCVAMLAYQTLDNMDGKQARRTQSSSPLGLLFDHGCDAVNSIFGSANWIVGMNLNPTEDKWQCWALVFGPFAMFYISTWEQYYTGELIMPIINGPNEGLLGGAFLSFISYMYGNDYWQRNDWWNSALLQTMMERILPLSIQHYSTTIELRNCDFIIIFSCVGFVQEILLKSFDVTRRYKGSATALVPFIVLASGFWIVGSIEPAVWLDMPRTALHLAMVLFVEQVTDLMVAHVTAQPFCAYRWQLAPLLGLVVWTVLVLYKTDHQQQEGEEQGNDDSKFYVQYFVTAYTWTMATYLTMKSILLINEICQVLKIFCFDIVTPYHDDLQSHSKKNKNKTKTM